VSPPSPDSAWSIFHSAVSDIDTGAVDRLKAIDPNRPIREANIARPLKPNGAVPIRLLRGSALLATILRMSPRPVLGGLHHHYVRI
jgi:hypothetical protein